MPPDLWHSVVVDVDCDPEADKAVDFVFLP